MSSHIFRGLRKEKALRDTPAQLCCCLDVGYWGPDFWRSDCPRTFPPCLSLAHYTRLTWPNPSVPQVNTGAQTQPLLMPGADTFSVSWVAFQGPRDGRAAANSAFQPALLASDTFFFHQLDTNIQQRVYWYNLFRKRLEDLASSNFNIFYQESQMATLSPTPHHHHQPQYGFLYHRHSGPAEQKQHRPNQKAWGTLSNQLSKQPPGSHLC